MILAQLRARAASPGFELFGSIFLTGHFSLYAFCLLTLPSRSVSSF